MKMRKMQVSFEIFLVIISSHFLVIVHGTSKCHILRQDMEHCKVVCKGIEDYRKNCVSECAACLRPPAAINTASVKARITATKLPPCTSDPGLCKYFTEDCDKSLVQRYCKSMCKKCVVVKTLPGVSQPSMTMKRETASSSSSSACEDKSPLCGQMRELCSYHRQVRSSCKRTCLLCSSPSTATKSPSSSHGNSGKNAAGECIDETYLCNLFSDHCFDYPKVRIICKKTCHMCPKSQEKLDEGPCEDFFPFCEHVGPQCLVSKYTRTVCRKACKHCKVKPQPVAAKCQIKVIDTNVFRDNCLKSQNAVRLQKLTWDDTLQNEAQEWAEHLAKSLESKYSAIRTGGGENIAILNDATLVDDPSKACSTATAEWMSEAKHYDFRNPVYSQNTARFVQTIWASSTKLGIGIASCPMFGRTFVVARYFPAGNIDGLFSANVV